MLLIFQSNFFYRVIIFSSVYSCLLPVPHIGLEVLFLKFLEIAMVISILHLYFVLTVANTRKLLQTPIFANFLHFQTHNTPKYFKKL